MKKLLFGSLAVLLSAGALAQCDKPVTYTSSGFNVVDSLGNVQRSKTGFVEVEQTRTHIKLIFDGDPNSLLTGDIVDLACSWKEPFKSGKTTFTTDLLDHQGETKHARFTIEGVNGRIVITGRADYKPNELLQINVEKYEEK